MKFSARCIVVTVMTGLICTSPAFSQSPTSAPDKIEPPGGRRVFGVIPNYRTVDVSHKGTILSPREKLAIASKDSFDYPLILLAGASAGVDQLVNKNPSFGQGLTGYGRRTITNYSNHAVGNMFTEGLFPIMLHEDPRYFRLGTGSKWRRTNYALTRVFVTNRDTGGSRFNFSEWLGNGAAVAVSNAYYPDRRNITDNVTKYLGQAGTHALSLVLKEFWPDIRSKLFHK